MAAFAEACAAPFLPLERWVEVGYAAAVTVVARPASDPPHASPRWVWGLLALALGSAVWPLLGLPVALLTWLGWLSLPVRTSRSSRIALMVAGLAATVALGRFVVEKAAAGVVRGGQQAAERSAVEALRGWVVAQDALRRLGKIDPDRDGVGSAATLPELCGEMPLRGTRAPFEAALRCGPLVETAQGPVEERAGFLYWLCLPAQSGGFVASGPLAVDDERAEREFRGYAWPLRSGPNSHAFAIDQDEQIFEASVDGQDTSGRQWPRCDTLEPSGVLAWQRWRGKRARPFLPGADPEHGD